MATESPLSKEITMQRFMEAGQLRRDSVNSHKPQKERRRKFRSLLLAYNDKS